MPDHLTDRRGFTLVELLVSMTVGMLILGAAFGLADVSGRASKRVVDRVDSSQRGRVTLDQMSQRIRSMSCLEDGETAPLVVADTHELTFNADLDRDLSFDPEQWRLRGVMTSGSLTGIAEDRWSNGMSAPPVAAGTAATATRSLIDAIRPLDAKPLFRYYAYDAANTSGTVELTSVPLSAADRERVARIDVAFLARPTAGNLDDRINNAMETSLYARTPQSNASGPRPSFSCPF